MRSAQHPLRSPFRGRVVFRKSELVAVVLLIPVLVLVVLVLIVLLILIILVVLVLIVLLILVVLVVLILIPVILLVLILIVLHFSEFLSDLDFSISMHREERRYSVFRQKR